NRRQQPPPGVSGWWKSEEATSKRDSLIKSQAVLEKQIKDEENSIGALNRYRMINERSNPEDVKDIPEQIQGMRKNIAQWRADKKRIQREISSVKWEPVRI
ncbi:MAG: hypothetical protein FWF34_03240, partial [Alphaproteobacteria bacterium]|nr:hypothetical protein [Alphaproteobacteria bacterium]